MVFVEEVGDDFGGRDIVGDHEFLNFFRRLRLINVILWNWWCTNWWERELRSSL
jgi:hypothetical protein